MSLSASLVVLANDIRAAAVGIFDPAGNQLSGFDASRPANAAISTLAATTTSQTLLASNPARRKVYLTNETSKTLFVAFAAVASATAYTLPVPGGQTQELTLDGYTGIITALLQSGTGNVRVTEVTS